MAAVRALPRPGFPAGGVGVPAGGEPPFMMTHVTEAARNSRQNRLERVFGPGPRPSRPGITGPAAPRGMEGREVSESALKQAPASSPAAGDRPAIGVRLSESLVALTRDDSLRETLAAVAPEHALTFVRDVEDLSSHLQIEPAGVAILDSAALNVPPAELTRLLRAQFPELVLIVAGGPQDQAALSAEVAQGTVYRFLHKPVSAQRVKLFVDAAWRRHDVEHATGTFAALKLDAPSSEPTLSRRALWIGAAALAIAVSGALVFALSQTLARHRASHPSPAAMQAAAPVAAGPALAELLARADAALTRGALTAPPAENAADLYRQVLQRDATNAPARKGLLRVADDLLTEAEQALLSGRLDEAARLTDAARAIEPDNVRVTFLTAQIGEDRRRSLPPPAAAQREAHAHELQAQVQSFLSRAESSERSGDLLTPADSNAKLFVDAAAALAPDDPAVRKARLDLAKQMMAQAQAAVRAGNLSAAERWTQAASDAGAPDAELRAVQRSLQDLRAPAQPAATDRALSLFDQRLAEGKLSSPAHDSAQYYLAQLEAADPTRPSTLLARTALAARLLDEARRAAADKDFGAAWESLANARTAGASDPDAAAVESTIAAARSAATIRPESMLEKVHNVAPVYPPAAELLGRGGYVDLQFTVRADGTVADITVTHAEPRGMFDSAAIEAVRKWRYKPVMLDGRPADQRASLRVVFKP